jgi:hypothetical protein
MATVKKLRTFVACIGSVLVAAHLVLAGWYYYCDLHPRIAHNANQGMKIISVNVLYLAESDMLVCILIRSQNVSSFFSGDEMLLMCACCSFSTPLPVANLPTLLCCAWPSSW